MVDKSKRIRIAEGPVGKITDGDTIVLEYLDYGWGLRQYPIDPGEPGYCAIRITLPDGKWYDAPETTDKARNKLAVDYLTSLLPLGTWVRIKSYGLDQGRTLASITLPDGRDVATVMIAAGHVK